MVKHRKTWTSSEKSEVINYFEKWNPTKISRRCQVSAASIYIWKATYKNKERGIDKITQKNP